MTMAEKQWYTPADVAERLEISKAWVMQHLKDGTLPVPTRIGHRIKWPVKTIEDWIKAGCPKRKTDQD